MRDCRRISSSSGIEICWRARTSMSNTMMRSRGMSAMFFAEAGSRSAAARSADTIDDAAVGRQLAADQHVVEIRVGLELVDRADDVGEAQAFVPGHAAPGWNTWPSTVTP